MSVRNSTVFADDAHTGPLSIDTRRSSIERPQAREDVGKAAVELASIMAIASNPVSPGASSPPLAQGARMQDFSPPTRPSSTPFPEPEHGQTDIRCLSCPTGPEAGHLHGYDHEHDHSHDDADAPSSLEPPAPGISAADLPESSLAINLNDLPAEIHECILDHLFGYRVSATSKSSLGMPSVTRSWGTALRHSRRRELSSLALVSSLWTVLVQERLYRHIKIKATVRSLNEAVQYFAVHPHLRPYVRHIELWFAVFQPKQSSLALSSIPTLPPVSLDGLTNASYVLPNDNCSLEEAFYFVSATFPEVCVLTLEGGERKKAPKVRHFIADGGRDQPLHEKPLPRIPPVRTLVCKGQWNLIRTDNDFFTIVNALPNLQEWHGNYSKAKSKSYLSMAAILLRLPSSLTSLSLNLEGVEYRRELSFPPYFLKVSSALHFCTKLAEASTNMEHFAYTGRVCRTFFDLLSRLAEPRSSRLKSIDLTVKNCCRHVVHWNESGSGITDMNFINAFEALVLAGIKALARLKAVEYLRIRYVDLDSPVPPLNPYFILRDGWCSGVWSDAIIRELNRARPDARFEDLAESFGEVGINKDGRMVISPEFPKSRVLSLKLSNYAYLAGGIAVP
ncbi:hypothetical protein M406DRAFT_347380 [Cryphonectria parasitica EP155]|uniref:Uncharacterized protein n=1 Tax=Cryphonectria parasitica (strain ATCC 38755 / EP155) TaxID=660469 RepID=A0A9P5CKC6_CRYP1|nr:uncharacterized protein M406DRAFT_347380 [Cryphonectria parasitica EP155]KAF3762139.1 hypothetical protein M406DRAFT_347380 [Cryphonectria parasitica EP155]